MKVWSVCCRLYFIQAVVSTGKVENCYTLPYDSISMRPSVSFLLFVLRATLALAETSCKISCICEESDIDILCKGLACNDSDTGLKKTVFQNCSSQARNLHIVKNGRVHLYPGTFLGLHHLYWLNMKENILLRLETDIFKELYNLEVLFLENNEIETIKSGAFIGLTHLTTLSLSNNKIGFFEDDIFHPLENLNQLRVINNSLDRVKSEFFFGLVKLNRLYLNYNNIHALQPNAFVDIHSKIRNEQSLHNLQLLYLQDNRINTIEEGAFEGLDKLVFLNMNNNKFEKLRENMFRGLVKLSELRLDNCSINEINSGAFRSMKELRELHLKRNRLIFLSPSYFEGLSQLRILLLSRNKIKTLEVGVFKFLKKLRIIDLSNNSLEFLTPEVTKDLVEIKEIYLSSNKLKHLPNKVFRYFSNLKVLNLDNNGITIIQDETFLGLKCLRQLYLRNNFIFSLTNDTPVNFYNTKTPRKPLLNFKELTILDLYNNKISKLHLGVFRLVPKLCTLNLGNNDLSFLNYRVFADVLKLREVALHNNLIACNCDLQRTWQWFVSKRVNLSLGVGEEPKCSRTGRKWSSALSNMTCVSEEQQMSLLEQFGLFMIGPTAIIMIGLMSWGYSRLKRNSHS